MMVSVWANHERRCRRWAASARTNTIVSAGRSWASIDPVQEPLGAGCGVVVLAGVVVVKLAELVDGVGRGHGEVGLGHRGSSLGMVMAMVRTNSSTGMCSVATERRG